MIMHPFYVLQKFIELTFHEKKELEKRRQFSVFYTYGT